MSTKQFQALQFKTCFALNTSTSSRPVDSDMQQHVQPKLNNFGHAKKAAGADASPSKILKSVSYLVHT